MRLAASRLAIAGLASRSLIQKRVAIMLLEGVQNSVIHSNATLNSVVETLCDCLRTSHTQRMGDALDQLDSRMGDEVPGLSDLVQSAKWHLDHGFLFLLFGRGLLFATITLMFVMAANPHAIEDLWIHFIDAVRDPAVRSERVPPSLPPPPALHRGTLTSPSRSSDFSPIPRLFPLIYLSAAAAVPALRPVDPRVDRPAHRRPQGHELSPLPLVRWRSGQ